MDMRTKNDGTRMTSRRKFLASLSVTMMTPFLEPKSAAPLRSFGIAYTSFPIRMRQTVQAMSSTGPSLPAEKFIDLCKAFGSDGCQMDIAQLSSTDTDYLKRVRASVEEKEMFLELSVSSRVLGDAEAFERAAATARQLGVSRLRTALLSGRRYENFPDMERWKDFVSRSQQIIQQAEPLLKKHKLVAGIENHKDWLADELAEMLRRTSSPYLGACVDFGNNLALLEDSVEVARKLAPYAVTTHVKDMALTPYDQGFELSEVPLGEGILPLARITDILRSARHDVHLCLEMITRDPLKVPYREDGYWATYDKRNAGRIQAFETSILSKASKSLPRISGLSNARMLEAEDDNIRRSVAFAKKNLVSTG